jgi:Zn-dependent M16 (insulinase) family peptidase
MKVVLTGCSTYIYIGVELRATLSDLIIYVGSVPTEHLDTFDAKLHESFHRIVKEGVDLNRMRMVIDRDERQVFSHLMALFQHFLIVFKFRSKVESNGGDTFSTTMIANFLYGRSDGSQVEEALNEIKFYNTLRTWSSEQWADLIQKCAYSVLHSFFLYNSPYFADTLLPPIGLLFAGSLLQPSQSALRKKKRLA